MRLRHALEAVGKAMGYKHIRYAIPYRIKCKRHKRDIDFVRSFLADDLSVQILDAAIKSRQTRNYKYLEPFYNSSFEKELLLPSGMSVTIDTSQYFPDEIFVTPPYTQKFLSMEEVM